MAYFKLPVLLISEFYRPWVWLVLVHGVFICNTFYNTFYKKKLKVIY